MKIALAQLNYHIGNFEYNFNKIKTCIEKARSSKTDLVVFSEMSVCGYPPLDLLENRDFIEKVNLYIGKIAELCTDVAAIIGAPVINPDNKGKKLFNAALFLYGGKILGKQFKTLLPTYDIFDEYRYFEPNSVFKTISFKGERIALTICEDLWDDQPVENSFARSKLYGISPMEELEKSKPSLIINIASSPFSCRQENVRESVLIGNVKKYKIPLVYVNQVGANTELIFDGGSMIINKDGNIINKLKLFEEDFVKIDLNQHDIQKKPDTQTGAYIEKIYQALALGIRDYFFKAGFEKAILGLSGGIDSAVTLVLACKALGNENVRVLLLPSKFSSQHSVDDASKLAENLGVKYEIISIQDTVDSANALLKPVFRGMPENITEENIQARIRGVILMALSNKFGNILLNTSNKSEIACGYGTLYGDMCGGLSVIGDVYKTDVYKLAEYINKEKEIIPLNTIQKPPSAELKPDQKDSDSLPVYEILDQILYRYIELKESVSEIVDSGFDIETVLKTIRLVDVNEYKRFQSPPVLRVSSKAFGIGRRIPLVAKY
ncbi:MAG: NAD+ synthase [Bacteroidota bacterium]